MKTKRAFEFAAALLLLSTLIYQPSIYAQGTVFTYQGRLNDGSGLANGSCDFTFSRFVTNVPGVADGVAPAASQGLNQKLEQKQTEITELKQETESLERSLASLEKIILPQHPN